MNVLMISRDYALLSPNATNESVVRHVAYARRVDRLVILVLSLRRARKQPVSLLENCTVHAVTPFTVIRRLWSYPCNLIVAQDPHAAGIVAWLFSRVTKAPFIVHMHGDFIANAHWRRERALHMLWELTQGFILHRASAIRVVSETLRQKLITRGFAEKKIVVIPTPVNDSLFVKETAETRNGAEELRAKYDARPVVLFVGRLVASKNLFFVLDVIRAVKSNAPNVLFLIIGGGELQNEIERKISEKDLAEHVVLVGEVPAPQLASYYRIAHVFLLLSTNESFGKVIVEAGLSGLPTLASATAGASSIITDGVTGALVPVNDLDASVEALSALLADPIHARKLGAAASQHYSSRFGFNASVDAIHALWRKVSGVE